MFIFLRLIACFYLLIIWQPVILKFLLPLYIFVKEILKTSTINLSVKSLSVREVWDFSRLWDVTLCNPVDAYQFLRSSGTYLRGCMTSHLAIPHGFLHNFKLLTQGKSQYLPALFLLGVVLILMILNTSCHY
jgi:hypothetical protein